jgi:hypothetical protein
MVLSMVYRTPKHVGAIWQIYCYINIYVRLVDMFEELSTRLHGTENFTTVFVFVVLEFKEIGLWSSGRY